jgi:hypothetical protein
MNETTTNILKRNTSKTYLANEVEENLFIPIQDINTKSFIYDKSGNITNIYEHYDDCEISSERRYEDGRIIWEQSDVHRKEYKYDDDGCLVSAFCKGDFGEEKLSIYYDENGHRVEEVESDLEDNGFKLIYDGGRIIESHDSICSSWYEYDDEGNARIEKSTDLVNGPNYTIEFYDDEHRTIMIKTARQSIGSNEWILALEEYDYDIDSTIYTKMRRYKCNAKGLNDFLYSDDFNKELYEVNENRIEEQVKGNKKIKLNYNFTNNALVSKEITISDIKLDRIINMYTVIYKTDSTIVIENSYEYWD